MVFCYGLYNLCIIGVRAWFALPAVSQTHSQSRLVSTKTILVILIVLFFIFMEKISKPSQVAEGPRFDGLRILSLLFADDVVLLA